MKKMLIALMVLLSLQSAIAFTENSHCINSTHLYEELEISHYVDGAFQETEKWNNTVSCNLGCNNGKCIENVQNNLLLPVVMYVLLSSVYLIMWNKAKGDKFKAFYMFLFMIHVLMGVGFSLVYTLNTVQPEGFETMWLWVLRFTVIIMVVNVVLTIVYSTEKGTKKIENMFKTISDVFK